MKKSKNLMVRACFFPKKKNDLPRAWPFGWLKALSSVLFPHRLRCRPFNASDPMPLRLAAPAEPQAAKRLKTDQKSVPLARFVVYRCWVFGSKWKKYNNWKFSSAIIRQISRISNYFEKKHDVWWWCRYLDCWRYGLPMREVFPSLTCAYFLQKVEVVTTN